MAAIFSEKHGQREMAAFQRGATETVQPQWWWWGIEREKEREFFKKSFLFLIAFLCSTPTSDPGCFYSCIERRLNYFTINYFMHI